MKLTTYTHPMVPDGEMWISENTYSAVNGTPKAKVEQRADNTARNKIAVDVLRGVMARTLFGAESQSKIVAEFQRQLSSVA